jgi:Chain length determinant protein
MTQNLQNTAADRDLYAVEDESGLSIKHFITAIRQRSRIVWAAVLLCVLIGAALAILPPPQYTISFVVYPSQSSGDKSGLSGTLSSLAAPLAGLIGSSATSDVQPFDLFMELIVSPRLAQKLIDQDKEVLPKIFYKEWDPVAKKFHPPHDPISTITRIFDYVFGLPAYEPPSASRLATWMQDNLVITAINSTSMNQISFNTPYPQFGQRFLKEMASQADGVIRDEALKLTDVQIAYLENKLAQVQTVDYRQTLLGLLSGQETTRMSINKDLPYAAAVLQNSFSTDLPTSPNPLIIMLIAIFVGLAMGTFAALTAAMVWPHGARRLAPSRYRLVTVYRRTMAYILTVPEKAASPAE